MQECERWELYKTDVLVKKHSRKWFAIKRPLSQDYLLDKIKAGVCFIFGDCDIKMLEYLRAQFAIFFAPIFENTKVCICDFGPIL